MTRFIVLYAALFAAFGVASPFFAAFLGGKGLGPGTIGLVLAAGTATRLLGGPIGGRIADRLGKPRLTLVAYAAASSAVACAYFMPAGPGLLLVISIAHAIVLAPLVPIADALALAEPTVRNRYGWVRGTGSAAFIVATLVSGQAITRFGLIAIVALNAILLAFAAVCAGSIPSGVGPSGAGPSGAGPSGAGPSGIDASGGGASGGGGRSRGAGVLLRLPVFRRLLLVAALIQGSHVFHDSFVVIHWRSLGIGDSTIAALWSESVAAEVVVFLLIGRPLLDRLGPANVSILAAVAGILRWVVLAQTTSVIAAAAVEPLHGLTFALQHLACMRVLAAIVPEQLAATAQALYGTVAVGFASAALTLASGPLYAAYGAGGFWVMAALCAVAIPFGRRLSERAIASP